MTVQAKPLTVAYQLIWEGMASRMKFLLGSLSHMRNRYLLGLDFFILLATPYLAIILRTESVGPWSGFTEFLPLFTFGMTIMKMIIFYFMGVYSQYWPYASLAELRIMLRALAAGAVAEILIFEYWRFTGASIVLEFPRSVPWLNGLISACLIGGTRLTIRNAGTMLLERARLVAAKPVIIVGAGVAGAMVARELEANRHLGKNAVGYVDDDPGKIGKSIRGVKVLGSLKSLPLVLKRTGVKDVIIALPTAPGKLIRQIVQSCAAAGVTSKTVPGLFDIIHGTSRIDQVRNVRLEDLLRRGTVRSDETRVREIIAGARVLVTGAGGSIGSEICRQVMDAGPSQLVLLGHGEDSIFRIAGELSKHTAKSPAVLPVIADIRDRRRMRQIFAACAPEVVFHAAAHKHLGLMETNAPDAVTNNVLGTSTLVDLAVEAGTERFVLISTDKAVNPTSILGVTKRVAELIVHEAGRQSGRKYIAVRFGNVLGSRGSVVPIFEQQIRAGGPITITHPDVKRFFMTIPEAVHLVLHSAAMGDGSEVFVLDMGEQISIVDLARDLLRLNGLQEGRDIDIAFTGLTPGEKVNEDLFYAGDEIERTEHEKIYVCRNGVTTSLVPAPLLGALESAAYRGDLAMIYFLLQRLVPEYAPPASQKKGRIVVEMEAVLNARKEPAFQTRRIEEQS